MVTTLTSKYNVRMDNLFPLSFRELVGFSSFISASNIMQSDLLFGSIATKYVCFVVVCNALN